MSLGTDQIPFPFFVGCGRSGTTLFRVMFNSHPDMAIPPETYFVAAFGRNRRRYKRRGAFHTDRFAEDLLRHRWFRLWGFSEADLRAALTGPSPTGFPDAVRRLFALYAHRRSKARYGDKTPGYVLSLRPLARLFPEARFIHVIRDGRDVALSLLDVRFGPDTLPEAALMWKRRVERGRRAGRALGPGRYREIHYETLLEDPEGTLRSVCPFVGLQYDEDMLRYHESPAVGTDVGRPEQHHHLALPPTKGLRDWRRDLSREDLGLFEAMAGGLLTSLGYERGYPKPPVAARASAAEHRLAATIRGIKARSRRLARVSGGGSGEGPGTGEREARADR